MLPIPNNILLQIENMIYEFIWNGKQHKVKKSVIIQDYQEGGYCIISSKDITTQNIAWIKSYLTENNKTWKYTMESLFGVTRLDIFLQINLKIPNQVSDFYNVFIKIMVGSKEIKIETRYEIQEQYIWHNKSLQFHVSDKIQRIYIEKGILKIKDVIDRNCNFLNNGRNEWRIPSRQINIHGLSLNASVKETKNKKYRRQQFGGIYKYNN